MSTKSRTLRVLLLFNLVPDTSTNANTNTDIEGKLWIGGDSSSRFAGTSNIPEAMLRRCPARRG